mmetsp:Transcript_12076/g.30502  ORF Transcript_12076/g.30502 Transcript_12076/m.30502 type:complete len:221 (+) Transcript_12076:739-1401(+)
MLRGTRASDFAILLSSAASLGPPSSPKPNMGRPGRGGAAASAAAARARVGAGSRAGSGACRARRLDGAASGTDSSACASSACHTLALGAGLGAGGDFAPPLPAATFSSWLSTHICSVVGSEASGFCFLSLAAKRSKPSVFRSTLRLVMLSACRGRSSSNTASVRLQPSLCRYSRSRPSLTSAEYEASTLIAAAPQSAELASRGRGPRWVLGCGLWVVDGR